MQFVDFGYLADFLFVSHEHVCALIWMCFYDGEILCCIVVVVILAIFGPCEKVGIFVCMSANYASSHCKPFSVCFA